MRVFKVNLKEEYKFLGENDKNPTLECYLPYCLAEMNRQDEKRPCIVICPGGAYAMCSEREAEPIAVKFLEMGFNAFVLYYSVAPHRYPTQLREVAAVFDLICKNADEWNCDTEKIGIIGFSAGGHLAANYSNAYKHGAVREAFPDSKKPSFAILGYPVISADEVFAHKGSFLNLLGEYPEGDAVENFSCEKLVTPDTPPTFIWHTAEDQAVSVKNSLRYAVALSENKVPFNLRVYPYGEHGLSTCDTLTHNPESLTAKKLLAADWLESFKKWFDVL